GIPVVAVVDSNSEPDSVTYPVPGNDDASRAINLYCDLVVGAVLDGIQAEMAASGADLGALEELPEEAGAVGDGAEEAPAAEADGAAPPEAPAEPAASEDAREAAAES
ncbi:MAG TPA: 30S ribosomal protein S2, partial [Geminicoccaceae bacterium]|nr:30S ribosomal protein S2 [Geminicoccaceae bacterium]